MIKSYQKNIGTKQNPIYETRWQFLVRYIDENGQQRQKKTQGFKTEKECRKAKDLFLKSMSKNTRRKGLNFEHLFNEYKNTWAEYSPSTIRVNSRWFELYIIPHFKNYLVNQIKMRDVIDFQLKLKESLSDNSVKNITAQLKSFLNYCLANGYIDRLPFYKRYTAVSVNEKKDVVIWSMEDFANFISYYKDDVAKTTLFTLLFSTGLRLEELLGIQKSDFNFDKKTIEIRRTYQFIGGKEYISSKMKTKTSKRTLSLPDYLFDLVNEYIKAFPNIGDEDRFFPFKPRRVRKWLDFGTEKTGVPRTTPHGLRHSFISNALSKGVPVAIVQKYAGHATCRTTLDIYTHCCKNDERAVCSVYDKELKALYQTG